MFIKEKKITTDYIVKYEYIKNVQDNYNSYIKIKTSFTQFEFRIKFYRHNSIFFFICNRGFCFINA